MVFARAVGTSVVVCYKPIPVIKRNCRSDYLGVTALLSGGLHYLSKTVDKINAIYIPLDDVVLRDKKGNSAKTQVNAREDRTNQNKTRHDDTWQTATILDTLR